MEEKLLNVSSSPHVRDHSSTKSIMRDVVIALLPAALVGIYNFRLSAVLVILTTCVTCMLSEYIWQKCMKQPVTTGDFSALLTGLLLALNLPATIPLWMCVVGGVFAIIVAKQLFGGLGQNFMNPALAGRCFMMLSFSSAMTSFTVKKGAAYMYGVAVDATSSATPLAQVKEGGLPDLKAMFLGTTTGTIGETSVAALLIGAIYLLAKRIIDWKIPVVYILTFSVFDIVYQMAAGNAAYPLVYELCGGGLILGAFFMATDYVTSPITAKGKVIYGILLGLLTGLFRFFGESAEGVSFAIIIANVCVPLIERWTVPKPFGKEGKANE
ncbi:MAG: RnfABCDGE type electron transport complex subunit D [Eubacterium sp.]|jgi:electron transport complex protein RnfD|nr:RnfABCDGE type electron transport complex subunit D [Eubacterium sp.]